MNTKSFLCFLLLSTGIGNSQNNNYSYVKLSKVEPVVQSFEIKEIKAENGVIKPFYSDSIINITFSFEPTHIDFLLRNNLSERIKIIWDDAIYMGVDEMSDGIFHAGVKYIDRESTQTPTSILGEGKIEDIIVPKNMVYYDKTLRRWVYKYLFFGSERSKIKILLPIETSKQKIEYIFSFNMEKIELKTKTQMIDYKVYYKSITWQ